jgi:hypothetical protein
MKKISFLTLALGLLATTVVCAATDESSNITTKKSMYHVAFNKIEVADGIDLALQYNSNNEISFAGTTADITKVNWEIKNGTLFISSRKGQLNNKVKIVLSVQELKEIGITGSSNVSSINELQSALLKIRVEGQAKVAIKNTGSIIVSNDDDIQLDVRKKVGEVTIKNHN